MITWIILVGLSAVLCYLSDAGVLPVLHQPVRHFGGSTISVILMLICVVMLLRAVGISKKEEKDDLLNRVACLEEELDGSQKDISARAKAIVERSSEKN